MLLMIDNYDSFTYNLVQYLGELGADVRVVRNDAIALDDVAALGSIAAIASSAMATVDAMRLGRGNLCKSLMDFPL